MNLLNNNTRLMRALESVTLPEGVTATVEGRRRVGEKTEWRVRLTDSLSTNQRADLIRSATSEPGALCPDGTRHRWTELNATNPNDAPRQSCRKCGALRKQRLISPEEGEAAE